MGYLSDVYVENVFTFRSKTGPEMKPHHVDDHELGGDDDDQCHLCFRAATVLPS